MQTRAGCLFVFIAFSFLPVPALPAAQGDILFRCAFDGPGKTPNAVWMAAGGESSPNLDRFATIAPGGVTGKCIKKRGGPTRATGDAARFSPMIVKGLHSNPITIVYHEKFSTWPLAGANVKSIRPFIKYGEENSKYFATAISAHQDEGWYSSYWENGTLLPTRKVTWIGTPQTLDGSKDYCFPNSDGTYKCPNRLAVNWRPGFGDLKWHKIRLFINVPSTPESTDGEIKVWIDEQLLYTLKEVKREPGTKPFVEAVSWYPSDEADTPVYYHYYDDITVYEGYVPPEKSPGPAKPDRPGGSKRKAKR